MTIQKEYFSAIINQLSTRSAEATLSILGISNPNLRQFLSEKFNQPIGEIGSDNFFELLNRNCVFKNPGA